MFSTAALSSKPFTRSSGGKVVPYFGAMPRRSAGVLSYSKSVSRRIPLAPAFDIAVSQEGAGSPASTVGGENARSTGPPPEGKPPCPLAEQATRASPAHAARLARHFKTASL